MSQPDRSITGGTRVAGVIGHPVRYSKSPLLHNAAYEAMGVDAVYVAFPVLPEELGAAVHSVRALDLLGLSVTIPHKEAVIPFLDGLSPQAERLNAVNCIAVENGRLIGHNTDGEGFVTALEEQFGLAPLDLRCVVVGAGGAARAVIAALAGEGAADIAVINRSVERTALAVDMGTPAARAGSPDDLPSADLVVNATPVGMGERVNETPLENPSFNADQLVVDLIYEPAETLLLKQAREAGARTANGSGMLLHQAAAQIALWTGKTAPVDVMHSALSGR